MPEDAIEFLPEGERHGPPTGWERFWWTPLNYLLALVAVALFGIPLVWMLSTSLRPVGLPPPAHFEWFPAALSLENYPRIFDILEMGRFARNSVLVVMAAVPATLVVASMAGFAISQLSPAVRRVMVAVSVATMLVPVMALWLTRFLVYKWLGILDTPLALIAPALMGTSPLFVLMFMWAFTRLPREVFEQARLDGAGPWRAWWSVGLPLVRPITIAVGILATQFYWSDFVNPLLYINNQEFYTLPLGVQALQQMDRTNWPLQMAGSVVLTLPVVALFVFAQRYFFQEERQRGWLEH
jgi:multiple sugar transport system permease protein